MTEVEALVRENTDMGALVIECTDLPSFAHAIQERIGKPIFDIVTLTEMLYRSLTRHRYGPPPVTTRTRDCLTPGNLPPSTGPVRHAYR